MKKYILVIFLPFLFFTTFSQRELWGTVSNGGQFGHGYIFKTDSIGNDFQIIHHFDSIHGKNPGALLAATGNKLYGLTASGGQNNQGLYSGGVFYEYDLTTSTFAVLQHFGPNNPEITGVLPAGDGFRTLTEVYPGVIYGQIRGGYQGGVVFAFNASSQTITTALNLPTFQGGSNNSTLGNRLQGALYAAPDGFLYGTTYTNSQCPIPNPNFGSIIRIDPVTNAFSIRYLCPCSGANGIQFDNHFVNYNDNLYSVTKVGGANNKGVIYSFDPATSTYTNKYNFQGGLLGMEPSTMVKASNGKFYGTAYGGTPEQGFPSGAGILFEFDPVTDLFTKKLDFTYGNGVYLNVGPFPFSLIDGNNGKLYGVTGNGVFEYNWGLNQTIAKGRFPIGMGWYPTATPSLTSVCRKPSYVLATDTSVMACEGTDFSFQIQSDNALSYSWFQNGIIDNSRTTATLNFSGLTAGDTGTWVCEMTNECGTTMGPIIEIEVTSTIAAITQIGSELHAAAGDLYQWIDCTNGNTAIGGEVDQVFTPSSNGDYAVITSVNNCSDTSECYSLTDLGVGSFAQIQPVDITLSPNPASDEIQLFADASLTIESVKIRNTAGQIILQGNSKVLKIHSLAPGTYFVTVETPFGNWNGKFLKIVP